MTLKLNQVIALEKGVKTTAEGALTKAYHELTKVQLFHGQERKYEPKDDDGDRYPAEPVKLQLRVPDVLADVAEQLTRLFDVTATKDAGNQIAVADVEVDGQTVISAVPVTTLLALEKKLVDLGVFVSKLPVTDQAENWSWDEANDCWKTDATETIKTKKIPRNHVKAPATDKHPAQVEVFTEDVLIGRWSTTKLSGAVSAAQQRSLLERVKKLQEAVKVAREKANMTEATDVHIGAQIFAYLQWT
jgi:hypothetical protein